MPVVIAIVDLHLDAVVNGETLVGRLGRDAYEDAGVAVIVGHLIDHAQGRVADLLARIPEHAAAGLGANLAVLDGKTRPALRVGHGPAVQAFAVEQRFPVIGRRGEAGTKQAEEKSSHAC